MEKPNRPTCSLPQPGRRGRGRRWLTPPSCPVIDKLPSAKGRVELNMYRILDHLSRLSMPEFKMATLNYITSITDISISHWNEIVRLIPLVYYAVYSCIFLYCQWILYDGKMCVSGPVWGCVNIFGSHAWKSNEQKNISGNFGLGQIWPFDCWLYVLTKNTRAAGPFIPAFSRYCYCWCLCASHRSILKFKHCGTSNRPTQKADHCSFTRCLKNYTYVHCEKVRTFQHRKENYAPHYWTMDLGAVLRRWWTSDVSGHSNDWQKRPTSSNVTVVQLRPYR